MEWSKHLIYLCNESEYVSVFQWRIKNWLKVIGWKLMSGFAHLIKLLISLDCWEFDNHISTMSDSAQLVQIINDVLQANDPNLRIQSEDILTNLRNDKPN